MSDKLRHTTPLNITFGDGERPTPQKLTALNNQLRSAAKILEKAIGDLWNQSGDSILVGNPLQIPNLARVIGEQKYMNPAVYSVSESFVFTDNVGTKNTNSTEAWLVFKPDSYSNVSAAAGSTNLTNKETNVYDVDTAGDWHVDINTGKLTTFSPMDSTDKLDYTVDPTELGFGDETLPSVIPDPRQGQYTGCRISQSSGTWYLHLPPRRPLTLTNYEQIDRYPTSDDISDNEASAGGAPRKLWQQGSGDALEDEHYRYSLPKEINDVVASLSAGESLPEGFLYLWDNTTNTVRTGKFKKSSIADWVFEIESPPNAEFNEDLTTTETELSYSGSRFSVIAAGTPIARAIWTLHNAMFTGQQGNLGLMKPYETHSVLKHMNPPPEAHADHTGRYPTSLPVWTGSRWAWDDHTSLLSRGGSYGDSDATRRDLNDNAMLGDLLMGSTALASGHYVNLDNDSHRVYFGRTGDGPYIQGVSNGAKLQLVSEGRTWTNYDGSLVHEVTMSPAQVISFVGNTGALFETVPAPGPGRLLVFQQALLIFNYVSVAYTGVSGTEGGFSFILGTTTNHHVGGYSYDEQAALALYAPLNWMNATSDQVMIVPVAVNNGSPSAAARAFVASDSVNKPINMRLGVAGAVWADGDTPLVIRTFYRVIDTGL